MRRRKCQVAAAYVLCMSAAISCAPSSQSPSVTFGSTDAKGSWEDGPRDGETDAAAPPQVSVEPSGSTAPPPTAAGHNAPPIANAAGGGAVEPTPPRAGSGSSAAGSGGSGGSGGGGGAATPEPALATLSFEVTTSPVGGRYQPKNIGAIWIENDNGKVVKTLQVWAGTRRRYLTGYLGAMAGSAIDVTASATLPRHQTHTVSWNLKDKSGAAVAPGSYRVRMELTDGDQTGRSNSLSFDTRQGPKTLSPSDAPSFSAMKLILQ